MANALQRISPFCDQIRLRRFEDSTLRILDAILATKNAKLLIEIRTCLKEFLRSESLFAIREAAEKSVEQKLLILDFLVSAFAIIDDLESCLALRYEALILRESRSTSHPQLRVSCSEWINFAEDAFDNGFYCIVTKACESALMCLDTGSENIIDDGQTIDEIQGLKDAAIRLSARHSVQVQATEYLKKKSVIQKQFLVCNKVMHPASTSFRNGIKLQNVRNLIRLQNLKQGQGCTKFQI